MGKGLTSVLRVGAVAIAASCAVMLAGCSGGVAGGQSGASGDTLKFGLLAPFSGSESAFGTNMKNGATLAVDEINNAGGINGKKIELITEDEACDATTAVAGANKLVAQGVVASVGGYCSGATLPTIPVFTNANIPMVVAAANSDALIAQAKNTVFIANGTGSQQATAAVAFAKKKGAKAVYVIDEGEAYSANLAKAFQAQAKAAGVNVVGTTTVTPTDKDFSAEANKIVKSKADFVYYTGYYQAGALLNRQAKTAGYKGVFLVGDGAVDAKFAEITGKGFTDNVFGTFTSTPDSLNDGGKWAAAYKAKFNSEPGSYSVQAYNAVMIMAEGMKKAGSTEATKVAAALHDLKGFSTVTGPISFKADGTRADAKFVIVKINDQGNFVIFDKLES